MPAQLGPVAPVAVVLGCGLGHLDELAHARALLAGREHIVIGINDAGADLDERVHHFVTYHSEKVALWLERRATYGRNTDMVLWTARHRAKHGHDFKTVDSWGGGSGLLASQVALTLSRRVILCGNPMNRASAHYYSPNVPWDDATNYRKAWERYRTVLFGRVRSFSGWTAGLLGVPNEEWVNEAYDQTSDYKEIRRAAQTRVPAHEARVTRKTGI